MSSAASLRAVLPTAIHARQVEVQSIAGTIQGEVINDRTGAGFSHIQVQLIDSTGKVVGKTLTNSSGAYTFNVPQNGLYVVREVVPKGFAQTAPNFASTAPVGSLLPGFGNSSWNYTSTNTNPALGPVGPAGWANIAPAGNDGFGSPIDITKPAINLAKVLKVNYSPTVPKDIINNSHQIQVQFPSTATANTVTAGGQVFTLTQFHYHDPAENTVHGRTARMEEHFVNVSASGAETVVAVFLQLGAHNCALDPVLNAASTGLTSPNSDDHHDRRDRLRRSPAEEQDGLVLPGVARPRLRSLSRSTGSSSPRRSPSTPRSSRSTRPWPAAPASCPNARPGPAARRPPAQRVRLRRDLPEHVAHRLELRSRFHKAARA